MNIAVIAVSPKPKAPPFFSLLFRRLVYLRLNRMERIMPHMMQTLIKSAIVAKPDAVICSPDSFSMPTCSAAAWATCVS